MLVSLNSILEMAEATNTAVGAFNTPNLESLRGIIAAAEEMNKPVIIMHAQLHEDMNIVKLDDIAPLMSFYADRAKVPVCMHLDHGTDLDYVKRALDLGFNSVMYDGSELDEAMNLATTRMAVEIAHSYGASIEAEIGSMGARENGVTVGESIYTDPDDAVDFVAKTGVDALACAFGTVHGLLRTEPKLDFDRVAKIRSMIDVPIVMHGGSGVSEEDYYKVIKCGVRKINYYAYMAKAGAEAVAAMQDKTQFHDMALVAEQAIKENVMNAIRMFSKED